ncbi:hypothetical protein ACFHWD_03300 [Clostridium sp. MT-14]|uniref:hypothetical protein n=1 Tax=Clostridium sp. MT-14 TaxID=3348360 RepID=UPI0035F395A3
MKRIKIHNCTDCPYSEFYTSGDPDLKPIFKDDNISYHSKMRIVKKFVCTHHDLKENERNINSENIPDWCPLESDNSFDNMLEAGQEFKKKLGLTDKEIDKLLKILKREEDKQ